MKFDEPTRKLVIDSRAVAHNGTHSFMIRTHITKYPVQRETQTYYVMNYFTVYIRMLPCLNTIKWKPVMNVKALVKVNSTYGLPIDVLPAIDEKGENWLDQCGKVDKIFTTYPLKRTFQMIKGMKSKTGTAFANGDSAAGLLSV